MEENNDKHEVDLDVDAIQHIVEEFQNRSNNIINLEEKETNTNNKNKTLLKNKLHNVSTQHLHNDV